MLSKVTYNTQIHATKVLQINYETFIHRSFHAKNHIIKKEQLKTLEFEVREAENKIKHSMKDVEVLNFGKEGKIFWTNSKTGSRIFRNKII